MAFIPLQEYEMAVDGGATAETAINLALPTEIGIQGQMQVMLTAKNTDITVKLGASGVTADATLTGTSRVAGNFTVKQDAVLLIGVKQDQTYISAIAEDESTATGILYIVVGYNSNA